MANLQLDKWQEEVLNTEGNICLRSGRQVGKSTVISVKAGEYAVQHRNKKILVIAAVERQAFLLFEKILHYLTDCYPKMIKKGRDRPTKSKINLNNGSQILCLPTGMSGLGIRGYTVNLLIADEAAFIPEDVWTAVTPMLATTEAIKIYLSTPFGRGGYYYECFSDPSFTPFHVSSEDCPRISPEFLDREKSRMSTVQYAQEYLGEFVDELQQLFPTDLIKSCMEEDLVSPKLGQRFMGVDVARKGGDEFVMFSVNRHNGELWEIGKQVIKDLSIPDGYRYIKDMDSSIDFNKIYIDDGGLGVGTFDLLMEDTQTRRKTIPINNASRSLDREGRKKRLLKEDLYANLLTLMEQKKVHLQFSPETLQSLKSVQYIINDDKNIKIFGRYTHIAEALIRAAWCIKDKHLNIWIC